MNFARCIICLLFLGTFSRIASAVEPPTIPIGEDAYRQWDRWPYQRIGARAYMRSTYDRKGGNDDPSHFLYQTADDFNVALDVKGPGILYFARYNHWHGSPWHYVVDGNDTIVQESKSADPSKRMKDAVFIPGTPFPPPLALTWGITKGADLSWVPIGFEKSFAMAYSRTHYGTGYYIYQQFVRGIPLSQPIASWDGKSAPSKDVLDLLDRSGTDIAPPSSAAGVVQTGADQLTLAKSATLVLSTITPQGPSMMRALEFSVPRDQALAFGKSKLRVTWDELPNASIDSPLALFFGTGTLYNRDNREYLVKAFPMTVRFDDKRAYLSCYFPMPFFKSAKIELVGNDQSDITDLHWSARYQSFNDPPGQVGYFHATYRDFPQPVRGQDLVLLDTREAEGGGDWSGSFVGTSFIFSYDADLGTLEGDPRFFFDDSQTPQAQGTGTEEWGGGGDYWGGDDMTLPLAGHPTGGKKNKTLNDEDKIESAYRFLLADLMPFGRNAKICLEHGGVNQSTQHYSTLTYWYGRHSATLIKTDSLKVGEIASETAHAYSSPQASAPYEITSRYELGPDSDKTGEFYPTQTDTGRKTTGTSEFTLKLDAKNLGVMLRRKLDYAFPNQQAEVFISDAKHLDWKDAGIWYLAGANTCVKSNPKDELGATEHKVETSNRRFRDDEFLVPRDLTTGRDTIRVRVRFDPQNIALFPGHPLDEQAWSEIRYDAYCFVE